MHAEVHCVHAPLPRTQIFARIFKSLRKPAVHVICVRHLDDKDCASASDESGLYFAASVLSETTLGLRDAASRSIE